MKTAISLPDPLFRAGERVAKRLKIGRSELYARALARFVEAEEKDDIVARLNRIYGDGGVDSALEEGWYALQEASVERGNKP